MPLDSNGIWQYEESETAAPVSTMLNRLAKSVSDAVAPLVTDTGWVNVSLASGITAISGYPLQVRRIGPIVYLQGRVQGLPANTQTTITGSSLDAEFVPGVPTFDLGLIPNGALPSSQYARVFVQSNGNIGVRTNTNTDAYIMGNWVAGDA